jgi:hypothetical protein
MKRMRTGLKMELTSRSAKMIMAFLIGLLLISVVGGAVTYNKGTHLNLTTGETYTKFTTVETDYEQWNSLLVKQNKLLEDQNKLMYIKICAAGSPAEQSACKRLKLYEKYDI